MRADPQVVMGPLRALLDLVTRRGLCTCMTGTPKRDVVCSEKVCLDERPRKQGRGRWHGEPRFAGNSYAFPSLAALLQFLVPEFVFDDDSDWPLFHVVAGAFLPFRVGGVMFRFDDPVPADALPAGKANARKHLRGDLMRLRRDLSTPYRNHWDEIAVESAQLRLQGRRQVPIAWLTRDVHHKLLWPDGPGTPVHPHVLNVKALSIEEGAGAFVISLRSAGIVRVSFWVEGYSRGPREPRMVVRRRKRDAPRASQVVDRTVAHDRQPHAAFGGVAAFATALPESLYLPMPKLRSARVERRSKQKHA